MARTVGIGIQDYGKIIENNCFYVDKTSFIKEWWDSGGAHPDISVLSQISSYFGVSVDMFKNEREYNQTI